MFKKLIQNMEALIYKKLIYNILEDKIKNIHFLREIEASSKLIEI